MSADWRDRRQFLAAARLKAAKNYRREHGDRDAYLAKAAKNARIDWGRMEKSERRRKARTKSLDSMLSEPEVQSHVVDLIARDNFDRMVELCRDLEQSALRLHFEFGLSRDDTAQLLSVSHRAVANLRKSGLSALRSKLPLPPKPRMVRRLHYGAHKFGGYHSLCPNWCQTCHASNPSVPGQPLPEKCSSCGTAFPPIEERWTPAVHANPKAAEVVVNGRTSPTKVAEVRKQKRALADWKEKNAREKRLAERQ